MQNKGIHFWLIVTFILAFIAVVDLAIFGSFRKCAVDFTSNFFGMVITGAIIRKGVFWYDRAAMDSAFGAMASFECFAFSRNGTPSALVIFLTALFTPVLYAQFASLNDSKRPIEDVRNPRSANLEEADRDECSANSPDARQ